MSNHRIEALAAQEAAAEARVAKLEAVLVAARAMWKNRINSAGNGEAHKAMADLGKAIKDYDAEEEG